MGICPPKITVKDGGTYEPNEYQRTLQKFWKHFWGVFVPGEIAGAEKVVLVINGDVLDGVHHDTVNILTNSWAVQEQAAARQIRSIYDLCPVKIDETLMVKGTEAHVGPDGESEDRIAERLRIIKEGEQLDYQLWINVDNVLFQFAHHIGTTSSAAYESSGPMRELVAAMVEAAQWGAKVPRVVVRSHRHRFIEVPIPSQYGRIRCVITPGWQCRTPFVERIDRMRMPHIGGVIFLVEGDRCQVIEKIYPMPKPKTLQI